MALSAKTTNLSSYAYRMTCSDKEPLPRLSRMRRRSSVSGVYLFQAYRGRYGAAPCGRALWFPAVT